MQRFIATVLAAALFAPVPALACGMYVPDSKEVLLADLLDQIDEKVDTAKVQPAAANADRNAERLRSCSNSWRSRDFWVILPFYAAIAKGPVAGLLRVDGRKRAEAVLDGLGGIEAEVFAVAVADYLDALGQAVGYARGDGNRGQAE